MFGRSTCWFFCIFVAVVIATVCTETDSNPDSNTLGTDQESKSTAALDLQPAANASVAASAASGTDAITHPNNNSVSSTVDCSTPSPNATAVSRLQRLSEEDKNKRLIEAAKAGTVQDVWALLTAGADVRTGDVILITPLHWAATNGHSEVVSCLLDAGAKLGARDSYRATPLHDAAWHGHTAVVQQLLAASADINATDFLGWTPLHNAARQGHREVVRVLLAAGADKEAKTDSYNTPLDVARLNDQDHNLTDLLT